MSLLALLKRRKAVRKIDADYEITDRNSALAYLARKSAEQEIVTGLLFVDEDSQHLHQSLETVEKPLNSLNEADLVPGAAALEKINSSFR